eukprot:372598-Lingulodinium_polyedra.AAC.1
MAGPTSSAKNFRADPLHTSPFKVVDKRKSKARRQRGTPRTLAGPSWGPLIGGRLGAWAPN